MRKVVPATAAASAVWARLASPCARPAAECAVKDRRLHRRIVHSRYGEPHRDGRDKLLDKARVLKGEPKGDGRGSQGDQDRNRDPERVVIDMRPHMPV